MTKFGIDHVRGGIWTNVTLSISERDMIRKMIAGNSNLCYHCQEVGHYASECSNNNNTNQSSHAYQKNRNLSPSTSRQTINPYNKQPRIWHRSTTIMNQSNRIIIQIMWVQYVQQKSQQHPQSKNNNKVKNERYKIRNNKEYQHLKKN